MSNTFDTAVRPLGDRVLIRKIETKERMHGSIIIPQTALEIDTAWVAEVLAVGKGRHSEDGTLIEITDVKAGDKIVIGKYMGTEVKLNDEKYYVVRFNDILGVVEDTE
jgi:chaperonin GroES